MAGTVHITLGSGAAACLSQSGAVADEDVVLTTNDNLSCGPLFPITDLSSWKEGRRAFWRSLYTSDPNEPDDAFVADFEPLASARRIVLWLGTSVSNQITLASLPALLRSLGASPTTIDLVQFEGNSRGSEILDLGMLNPQQVGAHPAPITLTAPALEELERAWQALISPEPRKLVEFLGAALGPLPLLRRGLRSILLRYPERASGLNAIERRALRWTRDAGPRAARVLGCVLAECYDAVRAGTDERDAVGDGWVFWRMLRLADASLPEPALELGGSRVAYADTTVSLTSFGRAVLEGHANFVDANGIDDWIAGVHLDSRAGQIWFHQDGALITRP